MAFVQSPIPQEEQNQNAPTGQTTPNPLALLPPQASQTGGSSGQAGTANTSGTAPHAGTSTQFGSTASKLSDYLQANKDQTTNLGNTIANNLNAGFGQVQGDINTAGNTFGSQVSSGYTPIDPTLNQQVQSNPTSVSGNADQVKEFQGELNDQYTGPSSFESSTPYANVQAEVQNAVQNSQLLNTPAGLSTYLQNNAQGSYTPGQNTLDTVLLSGNQDAMNQIAAASRPFSTLTGDLTNQATTEDANILAAQQNAQTAQQAAKNALGNANSGLTSTINQELANAEAGYTSGQNTLNNYIQKLQSGGLSNLTQQQLMQLGLDPTIANLLPDAATVQQEMTTNWNGLPSLSGGPSGADFSYPTVGAGPTAATVATPQDYATLAALSTLAGNQPVTAPIDASTAAQAGSYTQQNFLPQANSKQVAQDLYNELTPWAQPTGITPNVPNQNQQGAEQDYAELMNTLSAYLGLPAFNTNYPTVPTSGGGGGSGGGTGVGGGGFGRL